MSRVPVWEQGATGTLRPVGLQGFERRLERLVEGSFNKAFRSGLQPVEIGHRVTRVLDAGRTLGVSGRPVAPNNIGVYLSPGRLRALLVVRRGAGPGAGRGGPCARQGRGLPVRRAGDGHARARRVAQEGRLRRRRRDPRGRRRACRVAGARATAGASRSARTPRSSDAHPSAPCRSTTLGRRVATRRSGPRDDGFVVVDLGSMNGTRVNGVRRAGAPAARRRRDLRGRDRRCGSRPRSARIRSHHPEVLLPGAALPLLVPGRAGRRARDARAGARARCGAAAGGRSRQGADPRAGAARPSCGSSTRRARRGETFALADELTVGRGGGCGIVLADDTFVSQVHARFTAAAATCIVEDLGSRNGTFVNGEAIAAPTRLRRGDQVQFGSDRRRGVAMRLVVGAATDVGRVREGNEDGYLVDEAIGPVRAGRRHGRPPRRRGRERHRARGAARRRHVGERRCGSDRGRQRGGVREVADRPRCTAWAPRSPRARS